MIGFKTPKGRYYVCGSQPYRRGCGCGPGVYVQQDHIEGEVIEGLSDLATLVTDPKGFLREANEELRRICESTTGHDPNAAKKLETIDAKIANIRRAIEDGLSDAAWANSRLEELLTERRALAGQDVPMGEAPQIDIRTAMAYGRQTFKALKQGDAAERKRVVRNWVQEMKLAPERLEVDITYQLPEPVMNGLVAGAGFEPATFGL
ncbi:MAG: hypothetical protein JSV65_00860 [Armatimonadota bacterium]|nr:MAG: hypothetical protein JSV65_00860 [Armatimonadota bacterium]